MKYTFYTIALCKLVSRPALKILFASLFIVSGLSHAITPEFKNPDEPVVVDSVYEAFKQGEHAVDFRLRYSDVKQEPGTTVKGAQALTLRTGLSYETAQFKLFSAYFEFENVTALPDDSSYFSGSNNEFDDATILDPVGSELKQAWLAYDVSNTLIKYGRQRYALDNGRFIGSDLWQQNQESFSGLTVRNQSLNYLRIRLGRLHGIETSLQQSAEGQRLDLDAKYANIEYRGFMHSLLSVYYYNINGQFSELADSKTFGLRFAGDIENEPRIQYGFEYARQNDSDDNPVNYSTDYWLIEGGVTYKGVHLFAGKEVLGADGDGFFVTPLASLTDFQGWTGQFVNGHLGNIRGGIDDTYYRIGYVFNDKTQLIAHFHRFESEIGRVADKLGKEQGLEFSSSLGELELGVRYAKYEADSFGVDTRKVWLSGAIKF